MASPHRLLESDSTAIRAPDPSVAIIGAIWLAQKDWKTFALISIHLISNLFFTMNSVQDVMAYLLVPIMNIAIFIGAGALGLSEWLPRLIQGWWSRRPPSGRSRFAETL